MNLKKLDDEDVVFIDKPLTPKESELFSQMLRRNKERRKRAVSKTAARK